MSTIHHKIIELIREIMGIPDSYLHDFLSRIFAISGLLIVKVL